MKTDLQSLLITAGIGIVAGFLASLIVGGGGGIVWYLVVGLIGAFVGGLLLGGLGLDLRIGSNPIVSQVLQATIGAVVVIVVARLIA